MNHSEVKLGELIEEDAQRDAVHVAVAPVTAGEKLYPGQDIGFVAGSTERVTSSAAHATGFSLIGIVDPFLKDAVYPEQRFWMFLYPRTITSLRHDWSHPAFPSALKTEAEVKQAELLDNGVAEIRHRRVKEAEEWLMGFAKKCDLDFQFVMAAAKSYLERDHYTTEEGSTWWQDCLSEVTPEKFWKEYELFTGEKVEDEEGFFFSCSC